MVEKGDLIGIADGEVFFVCNVKIVNELPVVNRIAGYRPVSVGIFHELRDKELAIRDDCCDTFHDLWKDAVAQDRTELSYYDYASWVFDYEDMSYDQPLWFFGQDCSGEGEVLIEDMELHEKVKADLESLIGMNIGSWEWSCLTDPSAGLISSPLKWDVIYNQEAVDACNRYCAEKDQMNIIGF